MPLVVQKYGGTSLGNAERLQNVAHIIANTVKQHKVIVVVSAMSSYTKAEGTTSRLLEAGNLAINGGPFFRVLDLVEQSHFKALEEAISDTVIMEEVKEYIHEELRSLKAFLEAIHVIHEISPRSQDLIIGTGERLSARLLSGVLKSYGIDSTYTDLSQCVEENLSPNNGEFYSLCQQAFRKKLPENQNDVPVMTGFFGFVSGGIINRIGRGYSDLTAALIAAEMQAEELQVWKEVDGIFSADPRKVPTASVLDAISPSEAAELTYFGSEVLHPFTMERAIQSKVQIRIKNTFAPEKPGTLILPEGLDEESQSKRIQLKRTAIAVTTKNNIHTLNINSNRMLHSSGFIAKVFDAFRHHGVVIDLISTSEVNISCTVNDPDELDDLTRDLEELGTVTVLGERAILSLVGEGMRTTPGTAGKMFSALAEEGINIEMITQGASEINISCVILQSQTSEALKAIHRAFLENQ
ncbi:MAG: aspartate kinase [SAR324 cluster bacterium]|jgi:aspartate kinase|nr:hypothetical protein [Deltaproteobacteria bacterium]MDP6091271.1 aspartate kinase [SAR324 cluster bacterium]MBI11724.1 hypothetical protein [Deltaproteobacteria bacterium]MBP43136.1 hypothetical protein [Deltaproteobacteria bacterium]MDP6247779.1 aspartate kinase [SAR324 cluster bacterium]|tara:strand:- start:5892 stop:7295 length:1404 start_codon:yes stop_codon:yes gene_type:complete